MSGHKKWDEIRRSAEPEMVARVLRERKSDDAQAVEKVYVALEASQARVAELEAALAIYTDPENWHWYIPDDGRNEMCWSGTDGSGTTPRELDYPNDPGWVARRALGRYAQPTDEPDQKER